MPRGELLLDFVLDCCALCFLNVVLSLLLGFGGVLLLLLLGPGVPLLLLRGPGLAVPERRECPFESPESPFESPLAFLHSPLPPQPPIMLAWPYG